MPNRPHFISVNTVATVNESGNNTETVMSTLTGIVPEMASQVIKLGFSGTLQLGASSVGGTFRFRRATLTGTLVGIAMAFANISTAAGKCDVGGNMEDTPGEGLFTYVLTYQGTGDTGVGGMTDSEFWARWD
jgi:hypothetical protein